MDDENPFKSPRQVRYFQRLAQARERLLNAIRGLDPETICTAAVTGQWTVKDIFAHIVTWNQEFKADIAAIMEGKHPGFERQISDEDDFSRWNQEWFDKKRSFPWERVWEEFEQDYRETEKLIRELEPRDYRKRGVTPWKTASVEKPAVPKKSDTESIETLVTYHWRHMNQHAVQIEQWRKRIERKTRR